MTSCSSALHGYKRVYIGFILLQILIATPLLNSDYCNSLLWELTDFTILMVGFLAKFGGIEGTNGIQLLSISGNESYQQVVNYNYNIKSQRSCQVDKLKDF